MINLRTPVAKRRELAAQTRLSAGFERSLYRRVRAEINRTARAAAEAYTDSGKAGVAAVVRAHARRLKAVLAGHHEAVIRLFGTRVIDQARKSKPAREVKLAEDQLADAILAFSDEWTATKVVQISNTTAAHIANAIQRGLDEGWGQDEVARLIREKAGGIIAASRAETIARTETHTAAQYGSVAAAESLDIPLRKEWVSVGDERTRDDHSAINGQVQDLSQPFEVDGAQLDFPGDPAGPPEQTINCRCATVYNADA